ncbi:MAG: hypothetical protein R3F39_12785 [Myxococcota bacterium]
MLRRFVLAALLSLAAACGQVSREDAEDALDQAALAVQAHALMATVVELGKATEAGVPVESAATNLGAAIGRRVTCATTTVTGDTVLVDFGTAARPCTYSGHTLSGCAQLRVLESTADTVVIDHYWLTGSRTDCHEDDFSDGAMTVDGTATVTWVVATKRREIVQHDIVWRENTSSRTSSATGALAETDLAPPTGVRVDGTQTWMTEGASWQLDSSDVALAFDDYLPSAGTHVVTNPSGARITIRYTRSDPALTRVDVSGGGSDFSFDVYEP